MDIQRDRWNELEVAEKKLDRSRDRRRGIDQQKDRWKKD